MKKQTTILAIAVLFGAVSFAWWNVNKTPNPTKESTHSSFKTQNSTFKRSALLTPIKSGESLTQAIDLAARITRENSTLTPAEATTILNFISAPKPTTLTDGDWQHLVNNLLNALRTNPAKPVTQRLSTILADMAQSHPDPVLRLYAIQHISFWYPRETDPSQKQTLATLLQTLSTTGNEAGTATMVMSDLQRSGDLPADPETIAAITRAARHLAADPTAPTDVRVSAIHTLSDRQVTAALPSLRKIADDTTEHIIIRKAAIFTIGRLGTPAEDIARLKRLSKEHPRLAQASSPAVRMLNGE